MSTKVKRVLDVFHVEDKGDFNTKKFLHNNIFTLVLAAYLALEQIYYGIFTSDPGTVRQYVFLGSAVLMTIFAGISYVLYRYKPVKATLMHQIYEISFGLVGMIVAISRTLYFKDEIFAFPTIYIAVIYGFAVFFFIHPLVSGGVYFITCFIMIILYPRFRPDFIDTTFVQDMVTNNAIAWIAAVFSYYRFVREYQGQQTILAKNKELLEKTNKIQKTNMELQHMSNIDSLTNIFNRRKLNENLQKEFYCASQHGKPLSIVLMDIDYFKLVNDTFGHIAGDRVLRELGQILKTHVREQDIVGRWGGEEFLMICPGTNLEKALELAERIRGLIDEFDFELERNVTCSFGVAQAQSYDSVTTLIIRADNGLYEAKAGGRNRVAASSLHNRPLVAE